MPKALTLPVSPLTEADIRDHIAGRVEEHQQLDYKAHIWASKKRWTAACEAAKDVGALANAYGGHLVLGIKDKSVRKDADDWFSDDTRVRGSAGYIRDLLNQALLPKELGQRVLIQDDLEVDGHPIAVVTVPAWVHGLATVDIEETFTENSKKTSRLTFGIPIRDGDRTRWMTWDERERRMYGKDRGVYLRFLDLAGGKRRGQNVNIANRMEFEFQGEFFTVRLPSLAPHASVQRCDESGLTLRMTTTESVIEQIKKAQISSLSERRRKQPSGKRGISGDNHERISGQIRAAIGSSREMDFLRIPWGLVEAVWDQPVGAR